MSRVLIALAAIGLLASGATSAVAQDGRAADSSRRVGLSLADALRQTTTRNASIRAARAQVDLQHGVVLAARGAFDPVMQTSVDNAHERTLTTLPNGGIDALGSRSTSYSLGLPTLLRTGIIVTPQVDVLRKDVFSAAGTNGLGTSQATAHVDVLVPLARDRMGGVSTAPERAAEHELRASVFSLRHAAAIGVLQAAQAYWEYAAARERLDVYRSSEMRAQHMVDETKRLVDAEERPPADMQLVRANLSAKRVVRLSAEQSVVQARAALGLLMGLSDADIAALPAPATAFPAVGATDSPLDRDRWAASAIRHRADLAAAVAGEESADVLVRASASETRSRMDLTVGLGYAGVVRGGGASLGGLSSFFTPLYQNVPGVNATVGLRYELPSTNVGANGRAEQRTAMLEQQRIAVEDLRRQIASSVSVALEAIRNGQESVREAQTAVELSQTTVLNEQQRFRLGMGTLFDVIQSQDALTNALLGRIASSESYADALAALHFATGTLLRPADDTGSAVADVDALLMPPI